MAIEFVCPHCKKLLRTADDKAGARAACPHCRGSIEIPDKSPQASEAFVEDPLGDFFNSVSPSTPSARALPQTTRCPSCEAEIPSQAAVCKHCGAAVEAPARPTPRPPQPHRGGLILTLAICGWVTFFCFPLAISAAILGTQDLKAMREGRMDPSGETLTQVGQVLGIMQSIMYGLGIVILVVMAALA